MKTLFAILNIHEFHFAGYLELRTGLVLTVMVIFDETKKLIVKFHVVTDSADHSLELEFLAVLETYLKRLLVPNIIPAESTA